MPKEHPQIARWMRTHECVTLRWGDELFRFGAPTFWCEQVSLQQALRNGQLKQLVPDLSMTNRLGAEKAYRGEDNGARRQLEVMKSGYVARELRFAMHTSLPGMRSATGCVSVNRRRHGSCGWKSESAEVGSGPTPTQRRFDQCGASP